MTWQACENYSRYREGSTLGKRQLKCCREKKEDIENNIIGWDYYIMTWGT